MADQIEVTVDGVFTTHHYLQSASGNLGELTMNTGGSTGTFLSTDGRELEIKRTSLWRGWYELRDSGIVIGTAASQGVFRRTTTIDYRGVEHLLEPTSFWAREWRLVDPMGSILVEVGPRGVFKRGAVIRVLGEIELDLLVFCYHMVSMRWQEQSSAGAASAASS
jgi:hypothetical protein